MGPGLYSDIGKKAKDLLRKDFPTDQKLILTTYSSNGTVITASSTKKNESIFSEIQAQLKQKNVTVDVKANSDSLILTTVTVEELGVPGLKKAMTIPFPHRGSGKFEIQYLHDHVGISASTGMNTKPLVNLSALVGNNAVAAGVDIAYDTAAGDFTKYNAGLRFTNANVIATVYSNSKWERLTASYYHLVNTEKNTAVGVEVSRILPIKTNIVTFGTQHALDPTTTVKARYNSEGMASALIQHEWRPKSFFTLSTEVDVNAYTYKKPPKLPKFGLSLVLEP